MRERITRREFVGLSLAAVGTAALSPAAALEEKAEPLLPAVRWGKHKITRLLVGHNPIKGMSHISSALNQEMRQWFAADASRAVRLLRRCELSGINTCQMGFRPDENFIKEILRAHHAKGGKLQWIATLYSRPQDREEVKREIGQLLQMDPPPIGVQQLGNTSDWLMRQGKIDLALETLKMLRDAGLLVGLGSHNHEVIDHAESKGWDVDFYQCCFYRSAFSLDPAKRGKETFEEEARQSMTRTIRQVSKPCMGFKVLAAGRHCRSQQTIEAALRYAFEAIKPTDVVLLGMWQKHKDQVRENVDLTRKILKATERK